MKEVMGTDEGGRLLLLLHRRPTLVAAACVPAFGVCACDSCCARVQSAVGRPCINATEGVGLMSVGCP